MNTSKQRGFTLIELMIVIAIVGILAVVALPTYQDYTIRAKLAGPMAILAEAKTSVAEYYAATGSLPTSNAEAGINTSFDEENELVKTLTVDATGITLTLAGGTGEEDEDYGLGGAAGTTIKMTVTEASGRLTYGCEAGTEMPTPTKYLPGNCRSSGSEGEE